MLTSYKYWFIRRDDNGLIAEAAVRFYEGDIGIVSMVDPMTQTVEQHQLYIRNKRLLPSELTHLGSDILIKDKSGSECIVYTPDHFGRIRTMDELNSFLDRELAKDASRQPIQEQRLQA